MGSKILSYSGCVVDAMGPEGGTAGRFASWLRLVQAGSTRLIAAAIKGTSFLVPIGCSPEHVLSTDSCTYRLAFLRPPCFLASWRSSVFCAGVRVAVLLGQGALAQRLELLHTLSCSFRRANSPGLQQQAASQATNQAAVVSRRSSHLYNPQAAALGLNVGHCHNRPQLSLKALGGPQSAYKAATFRSQAHLNRQPPPDVCLAALPSLMNDGGQPRSCRHCDMMRPTTDTSWLSNPPSSAADVPPGSS